MQQEFIYVLRDVNIKTSKGKDGKPDQVRKELTIERKDLDTESGQYFGGGTNSINTSISIFPTTLRGNAIVDNPEYNTVEGMKGRQIRFAREMFDTSEYRFPSDDLSRPMRKTIVVSCLFDPSIKDREKMLHRKFVTEAKRSLKGLNTTILGDGGEVLGISSTEEQNNLAVAAYEKLRQASMKTPEEQATLNLENKTRIELEIAALDKELAVIDTEMADTTITDDRLQELETANADLLTKKNKLQAEIA